MTDPELAELIKKVAQAEKRRRLTEIELAEMQQARAAFEKAEAALHKFYAKGPHKKKKPGRPGFWKSPEGHLFVLEVDRIVKERGCKIAFAIRIARKKQSNGANGSKPTAGLRELRDWQSSQTGS